jgi:hypothetical protein
MPPANGLPGGQGQAVRLFRQARRQADREKLVARLTGRSPELLCCREVCDMLRTHGSLRQGIREVPLDAIVGSVERRSDFTQCYLPLKDSEQERWTSVQQADPALLPPIETYQIGKVHFVADGHHRVSVARQRGMTHIRSSVVETQTREPLSSDVQPDELAIKAEYVGFLDRSHLDRARPEADLSVTIAGQVRALEKQTEIQRAPDDYDEGQALAYQQAAVRWYD